MSETLAVEWRIGQVDPIVREKRTLDEHEWLIEITKAT
jgi:hypothetical protein